MWSRRGARDRTISQLCLSHAYSLSSRLSDSEDENRRLNHLSMLTAPAVDTQQNDVVSIVPLSALAAQRYPIAERMALNDPIVAGYVELPQAELIDNGFVRFDDRLVIDDVQFILPGWREGNGHPHFYRNLPFRAFDPRDDTCIVRSSSTFNDVDLFVFNTSNAGVNFGHFLHDFMLLVPTFLKARRRYPTLKCLFPWEFKYPIMTVLANELLGADAVQNAIWGARPGTFRKLIVPYQQFPPIADEVGLWSSLELRRSLTQISAKFRKREPDLRIFVSRRDGTNAAYGRNDVDSDNIENMVSGIGFTPLSVSKLTPDEILQTFSAAEVVCGVHGAGLMNVIFSTHTRPLLIELDAVKPTWRSIERFVRAAGIDHMLLQPQNLPNAPVYDFGRLASRDQTVG